MPTNSYQCFSRMSSNADVHHFITLDIHHDFIFFFFSSKTHPPSKLNRFVSNVSISNQYLRTYPLHFVSSVHHFHIFQKSYWPKKLELKKALFPKQLVQQTDGKCWDCISASQDQFILCLFIWSSLIWAVKKSSLIFSALESHKSWLMHP